MMERSVQGCFAVSLMMAVSVSGMFRQHFIREPDNQTAIEGEQVNNAKNYIHTVYNHSDYRTIDFEGMNFRSLEANAFFY